MDRVESVAMSVSHSKRWTLVPGLAVVFLSFTVATEALSQCSDLDGDGVSPEAGCGHLRDCNDADASISPFATEICNGIDDDCDLLLDEGCTRTCNAPVLGLARQLSSGTVLGPVPILWNGTGYALLPRVGSTNALHLLDPNGNTLRREWVGNGGPFSSGGSLAWNGERYAAVWTNHSGTSTTWDIFLAMFSESGDVIISSRNLTSDTQDSFGPQIHWDGSRFGIFYVNRGVGLIYLAVDRAGQPLGSPEVVLADSTLPNFLEVLWDGTGYAIHWVAQVELAYEVFFARTDRDGALQTQPITVEMPAEFSGEHTLLSAGPEYVLFATVVLYGQDGSSSAGSAIVRLDREGRALSSRVITEPGTRDLQISGAWSGAAFGAARVEPTGRPGYTALRFLTVDGCGLSRTSSLVYELEGANQLPRLAWNGHGYGVVWLTGGSGGLGTPYFANIECACSDCDGDQWHNYSGDCDDSDSSIQPGAVELADGQDNNCDGLVDEGFDADGDGFDDGNDTCRGLLNPNQLDDDADGFGNLCDCAPSDDRAVSTPSEVAGLDVACAYDTRLEWNEDLSGGRGTRYTLVSGLISDLFADRGFDHRSCMLDGVSPQPVHIPPPDPPLGDILWFLVRGENTCSHGSWGSQSDGMERIILGCPGVVPLSVES